MRTQPVITETTPSPSVDAQTGELLAPATGQPTLFSPFPFFNFSYSFNEMSWVDGQTRVRSRRAQWMDGRLQTENFEGTLDGGAYAQAIAQTQHLLAEQTNFMLRQFSYFLPFWGK